MSGLICPHHNHRDWVDRFFYSIRSYPKALEGLYIKPVAIPQSVLLNQFPHAYLSVLPCLLNNPMSRLLVVSFPYRTHGPTHSLGGGGQGFGPGHLC